MAEIRSKTGLLHYRDGSVDHARYYYGGGESEPLNHMKIDPEHHATWIEDDGAVGIRRGTSISVGASPTYSAHYEAVDWGN